MQTKNFVKGLVAGTIVGVAVTNMINPLDSADMRRINKGAGKAFTTIGSVMDSVVGAFR